MKSITKKLLFVVTTLSLVIGVVSNSPTEVFASNDSMNVILDKEKTEEIVFGKAYMGQIVDFDAKGGTCYTYSLNIPSRGDIKIQFSGESKKYIKANFDKGAGDWEIDFKKDYIMRDETNSSLGSYGTFTLKAPDAKTPSQTRFKFRVLYKPTIILDRDIKYYTSSKILKVDSCDKNEKYIFRYKDKNGKYRGSSITSSKKSITLKDVKSGNILEIKKVVRYNSKIYTSKVYKVKM